MAKHKKQTATKSSGNPPPPRNTVNDMGFPEIALDEPEGHGITTPVVNVTTPSVVLTTSGAPSRASRAEELRSNRARLDDELAAIEDEEDRKEQERQDKALADRRRRRCYWPDDEEIPEYYVKRRGMPCPECRRLLLDKGGQAVVCTHSGSDVASFRCKGCKHTWEMPVRVM